MAGIQAPEAKSRTPRELHGFHEGGQDWEHLVSSIEAEAVNRSIVGRNEGGGVEEIWEGVVQPLSRGVGVRAEGARGGREMNSYAPWWE